MAAGGGDLNAGAGFRANTKCPMYPRAPLSTAGSQALDLHSTDSSAIPENSRGFECPFIRAALYAPRAGAHQKRGPPCFSLLSLT
jgi:hypothetical protein